jgi:hypothetical protein
MRLHAIAMLDAVSVPVGQAQLSTYPAGFIGGKPLGHLFELREGDKPEPALGGVDRYRFSPLLGGIGKG